MSFAALLSEKGSKIVLYKALAADGRDFYAYIRCNEKQFFKMKRDYETGAPCENARDYGEIMYLRYGREPDAEAEAFLKEYLENR